MPITPLQLGAVWHTIAFGRATEVDSSSTGAVMEPKRRLLSLWAASSIIWLSGNESRKFAVGTPSHGDDDAAPSLWPAAGPDGASSSQPQWQQRPDDNASP